MSGHLPKTSESPGSGVRSFLLVGEMPPSPSYAEYSILRLRDFCKSLDTGDFVFLFCDFFLFTGFHEKCRGRAATEILFLC